ncbi:MAG: hypothetical protein ACPLPS_07510, partial [bacterium]
MRKKGEGCQPLPLVIARSEAFLTTTPPRYARHPFNEGEWFSEYPAPYGAPLFAKGEFGDKYPPLCLLIPLSLKGVADEVRRGISS